MKLPCSVCKDTHYGTAYLTEKTPQGEITRVWCRRLCYETHLEREHQEGTLVATRSHTHH